MPSNAEPDPTPAVIAAVERGAGAPCAACRRGLCGHEVVMSWVLGFKDAPRCVRCLATGLEREFGALRTALREHVDRRDCWRAGWARAGVLERDAACEATGTDAEWDAGDLGCGDLVLELRTRMRDLRPGHTLKLTARDPGAPADLPAWCGLTGHTLLGARHPVYFLKRRDD